MQAQIVALFGFPPNLETVSDACPTNLCPRSVCVSDIEIGQDFRHTLYISRPLLQPSSCTLEPQKTKEDCAVHNPHITPGDCPKARHT